VKEGVMKSFRWLAVFLFALSVFAVNGFAQEEKKSTKMRDVEAVISAVGQRTVTFQVERKGKVREEVVGIDEKTDIDRDGAKLKLNDLKETDKVMIKYEADAYTPAVSVKVIGKGEIKKTGGDD
jgi:hypothetical protein